MEQKELDRKIFEMWREHADPDPILISIRKPDRCDPTRELHGHIYFDIPNGAEVRWPRASDGGGMLQKMHPEEVSAIRIVDKRHTAWDSEDRTVERAAEIAEAARNQAARAAGGGGPSQPELTGNVRGGAPTGEEPAGPQPDRSPARRGNTSSGKHSAARRGRRRPGGRWTFWRSTPTRTSRGPQRRSRKHGSKVEEEISKAECGTDAVATLNAGAMDDLIDNRAGRRTPASAADGELERLLVQEEQKPKRTR